MREVRFHTVLAAKHQTGDDAAPDTAPTLTCTARRRDGGCRSERITNREPAGRSAPAQDHPSQEGGTRESIANEDYVSRDFARLEQERLGPSAWQMACREEEIPRVGDYATREFVPA